MDSPSFLPAHRGESEHSPPGILQVFNEVETHFIKFNAANITKFGYDTKRMAMNGRSFGTLTGLDMNVGEK